MAGKGSQLVVQERIKKLLQKKKREGEETDYERKKREKEKERSPIKRNDTVMVH